MDQAAFDINILGVIFITSCITMVVGLLIICWVYKIGIFDNSEEEI